MKKLIAIASVCTVIGLMPTTSVFASDSEDAQIQQYTQQCEQNAVEEGYQDEEKKAYVEDCVANLMNTQSGQDEKADSDEDAEEKTSDSNE